MPEIVILAVPLAAEEEALRTTFWDAPGLALNDAGEAVTPEGSEVMLTAIEEVNPFEAVALTAMVWL